MTSLATNPTAPTPSIIRRCAGWITSAWRSNAPLTAVGLVMIGTLLASLLGALVDPQVITGAPAWIKPAKFSISVSIFSFTFVWMLGLVRGFDRTRAIIGTVVAGALLIENVLIVLQVLRTTTSHFNMSTPLDGVLYSVMGVLITIVWLMTTVLAVLLFLRRGLDPAFAWALRFGVVAGVVGIGLAFQMTAPTAAQLKAAAAGQGLATLGAHSVGVADGGPGLPFVGWSTTGGDLRIPHFIGIHSMQLLPFIGWLLVLPAVTRRVRTGARVSLAWIAGLGFLAFIGLVNWQALRGQPLIAPDGVTLTAAGGLLAVIAVAAAAAIAFGRRSAERPVGA